jgi:hypothetical protein
MEDDLPDLDDQYPPPEHESDVDFEALGVHDELGEAHELESQLDDAPLTPSGDSSEPLEGAPPYAHDLSEELTDELEAHETPWHEDPLFPDDANDAPEGDDERISAENLDGLDALHPSEEATSREELEFTPLELALPENLSDLDEDATPPPLFTPLKLDPTDLPEPTDGLPWSDVALLDEAPHDEHLTEPDPFATHEELAEELSTLDLDPTSPATSALAHLWGL